MGLLNRYLFKRATITVTGLIIFAICVLLLERLLRIFQIVTNSADPAGDATAMIINLLPYYLGMAVPMALLLGVTLTVDRFSRSSELTAAMGAGISLFHMTKPYLFLAAILAAIHLFVEGYLQPVGRYNYRNVVHQVKQQSFTAALRQGTFTSVDNRTFFAGTEKGAGAIGPIFIYEKLLAEGESDIDGIRITTAQEGQLIVRQDTGAPVLQLAQGQTRLVRGERQLQGDLQFSGSAVAGTASIIQFRKRGEDERELTSLELFKNRTGAIFSNFDISTNNAALHVRLGRFALLFILPFIAVPLGLNYGRQPSSAGIFLGIVFLVSLQKALEFGQSLGASGVIPPWAGIWPTLAIVALFAAYLFWRSAYRAGPPLLTTVSHWTSSLTQSTRRSVRETWHKLAEPL